MAFQLVLLWGYLWVFQWVLQLGLQLGCQWVSQWVHQWLGTHLGCHWTQSEPQWWDWQCWDFLWGLRLGHQ